MGIMNKTTPIQSGKVYSTLNQPEVFVEYTGGETATTSTYIAEGNVIKVDATTYVVKVPVAGGEISIEDFERIAESTTTKIAVVGDNTNVLCSAAEDRLDTDTYYKYYGPQDASGYAYVVKVSKTMTPGAKTYHATVTEELIALMKEDFITTVTVGGVAAGTQINKGDSVADLLQTILKGSEPTSEWKFKYLQSTAAPTTITADWSTSAMPSSAKINGYEFNSLATPRIGFMSFAFNKEIGKLTHVYQGEYDILGAYFPKEPIEITYDNVIYYMYVSVEKSIIEADDKFKLVWVNKEN